MAVGKVRGGKAGGAGGVKGGGGVAKAGGSGFAGRVDRAESLVGPSGAAAGGNVIAADPISANARDIARQLKSGQLKSREEATKKLVADILKEKVRMQSKALTQYITEHLEEDPLSKQILEQIWNKGASDKEQD